LWGIKKKTLRVLLKKVNVEEGKGLETCRLFKSVMRKATESTPKSKIHREGSIRDTETQKPRVGGG